MTFWRLLRWYDKERIASQLERVRTILDQYCEDRHDHDFALDRLDNAFRKWRIEKNLLADDNIELMDAFGVAYGQFLADKYNLRWVAIPGKRHSYALLGGGDILVYPQNAVKANHERVKPNVNLFKLCWSIHSGPANLASMMEPTPDPPWWAFWRR